MKKSIPLNHNISVVTELQIAGSPDCTSALRRTPTGFTHITTDLSTGTDGCIYLNYHTRPSGNRCRPITNLMLIRFDHPQRWSRRKISADGQLATYYRIGSALSHGNDGTYTYLCYTYDSVFAPLTSLEVVNKENVRTYPGWEIVSHADLTESPDSSASFCILQRRAR